MCLDSGSISGSGKSFGGGNGNSLQYPCLENPMDQSLSGHSVRPTEHTCKVQLIEGCVWVMLVESINFMSNMQILQFCSYRSLRARLWVSQFIQTVIIQQIGWLIKGRNVLLTVLEAQSPKIWMPSGHVRILFWETDLFLYPYMIEGAQKLCGISFIRALISFMRAPPSWPLTSQRHHFLIPSPLGIRISTYTFWGGAQISRL